MGTTKFSGSGNILRISPLKSPSPRKKRKIFRTLAIIVATLFFLSAVAVGAVFIYFSRDLPDPASLGKRQVAESTKIYDRTGSVLLYEIHGEEKRTIVPLSEISPYLKKAAIAVEDKDFYSHEGVDLRGVARAVLQDIITGDLRQGGSTITQQLIKNSILTRERTIARKIKEWILAIELEQKFSKDQILEMYLNQIPYGSNAYGAEAAAQTFFGKPAKDLTLGEAAILAALPKAPTYYSPYGTHKEDLKSRQEYVISRMNQLGYINSEEAKSALAENALDKIKRFKEKMIAPHFVMMVKEYLADKYGDKVLEKGGLKVLTTLDVSKQKIAEAVISENMEKNSKKYNVFNAALVAINPKNGEVLSLVGSKDYFAESSFPQGCSSIQEGKKCLFDPNTNAAVSLLSPGSALKPIIYATLFKKGYNPDTILFDIDTEFNPLCDPVTHLPQTSIIEPRDCYAPKNYDLKFRGPVSIRSALAQSLNIPAVKTLYLAGIKESIATANEAGVKTLKQEDNYGLALVLGGGGVKLLELTSAYGVFATEGAANETKTVLKVSAADNSVLEDNASGSAGKQILDKNISQEITDILSDNVARTPIFGPNSPLYFPNRPVAAKTGTAGDYRAAWTIGYTPSLVAGVWAGNNDNSQMNRAGGVSAAAPIWHDFMAQALEGTPVENFNKPPIFVTSKPIIDGVFDTGVMVKIDKACGDKLAKDDAPKDRVEERAYKFVHDILFYVDKSNPLGPAPDRPQDDPQFANWEKAVSDWASQNGYKNEAPPAEYCEVKIYEKPSVSIVSPAAGETIKPAATDGSSGFNLKIEAAVSASAGIKQANFFFDGNLAGNRSAPPWFINFPLNKNIADGEHKISVKIFDSANNEATSEIKINLDLDFDPPNVSLKEPLCGGKVFCFLSATASDAKSGLSSVDFYAQRMSDTQAIKISGISSKDGDFYQMVWPTDSMASGTYEIWAKAKDNRGNEAVSEKKKVTI